MLTITHVAYILLAVAIVVVSVAFDEQMRWKNKAKKRHHRNVKKAEKVKAEVKAHILAGDTKKAFYILRYRTSPYVFEELVLSAFSEMGAKIKRNERYSNDGGIDGRVFLFGREWLIQSKRYSSYVKKEHIESHEALCNRKDKLGIFVHTGKTGESSLRAKNRRVVIVSGGTLLALIAGKLSTEAFKPK